MRNVSKTLMLVGFLCLTQVARSEQSAHKNPKIDPQAQQELKKMSDFLSSQKRFSVNVSNEIQVITKEGQKIGFDSTSQISLERPNHLRNNRKGEVGKDLSLYYDGKSLALFGRENGYYAKANAPGNLDQTIDFSRDKLGIDAPGADLFYSDPYRTLTEDVVSGMYVGETQLDGVPVHHLAFRGNETDWQIWIEEGERPFPKKYVITSKKVKGAPEFSVVMRDWNLTPTFPADEFTFSPPEGAKEIQFAGLKTSKSKQKG